MDSFQFVENKLYPSAPISNDDVDLSIKVSSSHRGNEYFDNASYKVTFHITLSKLIRITSVYDSFVAFQK